MTWTHTGGAAGQDSLLTMTNTITEYTQFSVNKPSPAYSLIENEITGFQEVELFFPTDKKIEMPD